MTSSDFTNHQIFEKLDQLKSRIADSAFKEMLDIENISFFETAENYLRDRLKLTTPAIVSEPELSGIAQEIEYSLNHINAFVGDQNIGQIHNAINYMLSAISRMRNLPLPFADNNFNFSSQIAKFESIVKEKYKSLEEENKKLKEALELQKVNIETTNAELQRILGELSQKENDIRNLNSNFQTEFNNIRSSSSQNIENDRTTFRTEFDTIIGSFKQETTDLKNSINTDTQKIISELENKLTEAKKIVGVIGDVSVVGNYQQIANSDKSTADSFRWIAIGLMAVMSGLLIYAIWDISSETYDWTKSLIRIIAAAALSYPATYAAKESSKHRRLEIVNRKAELELAAINPFIELLPENKKQDIKEKLVEKYFGNHPSTVDSENKKEDEEISINAFERILKTILPHLKK